MSEKGALLKTASRKRPSSSLKRHYSLQEEGSMKNTKTKKLLALILALVMLVGSALPVFAEEAKDDAGTNVSLQEIAGEYVLISYESYKSKYNYSTDLRTGEEVTVAATDYITDEEYTTADVEKDTLDGVDCIVTGETGSVSWKVDVPKAGL